MEDKSKDLHPIIKLTFATSGKFFGPGVVDLLREVERCGNVREACEKCGFSYSKGWTILKNCEEKFGYSLVDRQAGGKSGGTARVTDKGYDLLAIYDTLKQELSQLAGSRFCELLEERGLSASRVQQGDE